ncbi:hypothetical protein LCGC14_1430060 [marine sediment metagenome]|uniref:Zinc finger CHC2-type domain-containing protein n=1 Tax=marine sediment metagenome TaxID=412755 RepID=A0A0F9MQP7_9ZZZZ
MGYTADSIQEVKQAANIVDIVGSFVLLKKNGSNHFGLCPFHDEKTPSFTVSAGKQMFYCFGCGSGGDVIKFIMKQKSASFSDAVREIAGIAGITLTEDKGGINPSLYSAPKMPGAGREQVKDFATPAPYPAPATTQSAAWLAKAAAFTTWAHKKLLENPEKMEWLHARGINAETIRTACLGWNPGEHGRDLWRHRSTWGLPEELKKDGKAKRLWLPKGLVIPLLLKDTGEKSKNIEENSCGSPQINGCNQVLRIRIRRFYDRPPDYYVIPGSAMDAMALATARPAVVLTESELDAILINQEAGDLVSAIAMGTARAKPAGKVLDQLVKAAVILVALDFDPAGAEALEFWKNYFPQSTRWPPVGGKDPGEMFAAGVSIRDWIQSGIPASFSTGPSLLSQRKGVGGALKPEPKAPASTESSCSPLQQLADLLKTSPVSIHNTPDRLHIRQPRKWAKDHWQKSKQISELVFFNPDVFDFICAHPEEVITGKNILAVKGV